MYNMQLLRTLVFVSVLFIQVHFLLSYPTPLNCTDTDRLCTSFIAFQPSEKQTLAVIESMFDVLPGDVTAEATTGTMSLLGRTVRVRPR